MGHNMRKVISAGLSAAGHQTEADIALRKTTRFTHVPASFLHNWQVIQVDYSGNAKPVQYTVGVGGRQVLLLTARASAFSQMTSADHVQIASPASAAELATVYLQATRPTSTLTYKIDSVNEIKFRPNLSGATATRRDQIIEQYRQIIHPPTATLAANGGFTVLAYLVQDRTLQSHTLQVTANGSVTDQVAPLVTDVPVPYTL